MLTGSLDDICNPTNLFDKPCICLLATEVLYVRRNERWVKQHMKYHKTRSRAAAGFVGQNVILLKIDKVRGEARFCVFQLTIDQKNLLPNDTSEMPKLPLEHFRVSEGRKKNDRLCAQSVVFLICRVNERNKFNYCFFSRVSADSATSFSHLY